MGVKTSMSKSFTEGPGPGAYEAKHKEIGVHAPKFTLKGRIETKARNHQPGPGHYDTQEHLVKGKIYSATLNYGAKRSRVEHTHAVDLPGPGQYDQTGLIGKNAPSITLKSRIEEKRTLSPGPGQYEPIHTQTKNAIPASNISRTPHKLNLNDHLVANPGPGTYDHSGIIGKHAPSISIKPRIPEPIRD